MANIIYRRGMAMLDDANVSKDINDAISLCSMGIVFIGAIVNYVIK